MKPYAHLVEMLDYGARSGKGIVFIHKKSETRMSYRELYNLGMKLAQRLHARGWHSRDEVVIQIDDNRAFVVAFWGCLLGGFIPVPITTGGTDENRVKFQQVWGTLNHPKLLTVSEALDADTNEIGDNKEVFYLRLDDLDGWESEPSGSETVSGFEPFQPSGSDIAFLQFSSGSTGQPKGVILTHKNLISNMSAFVACSGTSDQDSTLSWLPLTHDMGLIGFHLGPISAGIDQYLMQPAQFMLDPMLWLAKVDKHRITSIASPNFGYKHFIGCFKEAESIGWDLSCVKLIFNGAEPISADWAERFLQLLAPCGLKPEAMFPVYGMAEATLAVTFPPPGERLVSVKVEAGSLLLGKPVKHAKDDDRRAVTFVDVGYPVAECEVAIRGDADNPVPDGTVGHIVIRGSNVTKGYYNAPEASVGALAPGGWLRTGDVGFMQDGRLVITGRFKDIIFVRGQNVYPHDLEKRAEAVDGVGYGKVAVCGALNADLGEDEIVLFVQHRGKPEKFLPIAERLKRQLSRETGFDIGRVVPIRLIPRTTSGKIQRYKLAERLSLGEWDAVLDELEALRLAVEIREETSSYETRDEHPDLIRLMEIWREALGVSSVYADDHFQELGGNSLKAAQALAGIRKLWGAELSLRDIFEHPTPRLLLERIRREERAPYVTGDRLLEVPFADGAEGDRFLASTAQKRMALLEQAEGIGCAYHIPVVLSVDGPLSAEKVADAIQTLTDRHETLRTSYHWEHGLLLQEVHSIGSIKVDLRIFSGDSGGFPKFPKGEACTDEELNGLLTPFDLSLPPLIKAALWTDEANSHCLALNVHHIASDGIGMNVLMQEFAALLNGEHLSSLKVSYKQFAVWEQRNQATKTESLAYWSRELANEAPSINWPDTSIRPSRRTFRGSAVRAVVPSEAARAWNRHARTNNGTISSLLLSLHAIILQRYCLQSEIAVGLLLAGRAHPDTQGMVGMFNNYIPVRMESVGEGTFREQWNRSQDKLWEALNHADVPYEKLIELSGRGTEPSRNPLFDTMLIYHNQLETAFASFEAGGCRFEQIPVDTGTAKLDLKLDVYPERSGALTCVWEFNELLFRRETVEKMALQFVRLAEWIAKDPDLNTCSIDLLSDEERSQVIETFNATAAPYPQELTLPELFRRQAEAAPDKLAASFEASSLTYRELDERANRIALKLLASGLRAGQPVGLMAERSPELLAGLLGILKAGGAYVPLPPDFPEERLRYMAANSGIELVCSQREWLNIAGSAVPGAVLIDLDDAAWREGPSQAPDVDISPEQAAYILYTSGSTGRPKGVMIRHRSVINRIHWMQKAYPLGEDDVILQKTPYSFDVSVWELFWWMLAGASVAFLAPGAEKDPGLLIEAVHRHRVSTMHFVPSMLAAFLEAAHGEPSERLKAKLATLGRVFASGEALHKAHVERFYALTSAMGMSDTRLVNLYGPTEATVDVSVHECAPDSALDFVPIGRPIDNTSLYVMNVGGQAAQPIGVPGELCIAGVQLAVGYANEPELTAEKFVPNPFAAGELMYRTGDLARWMADGQIEYLGRIDDQVKIRGYRIELGEIERTLLLHEAVSECAVTARDDGAGGRRLCAYVVADRECTSGELRRHCGERLPEYMIPASFTQLEVMPLTASGKTNRKALPAPEASMATGTAYAAPGNETEEKLAGIWKELLRVESIGIDDNFFELGGHSLTAATTIALIHKELNHTLLLKDIFDYPTIRLLACRITETNGSAGGRAYEPIERVGIQSSYPLSSAQYRLFVLQAMDENSSAYHLPSILRIQGPLDRARLLTAVHMLSERHETLRTSFEWMDDHPVQRISEEPIKEIEFEQMEQPDLEACIRSFVRPFRMSESPLFRVKLVRLPLRENPEHLLLLDMHHLIADGVSSVVLAKQFVELYEGRIGDPLPVQYKDYAAWQANWLKSEESRTQELFWKEKLSGAVPVLNLPTDYARPPRLDYAGDVLSVSLDSRATRGLADMCARTGTTLYMALLGAFTALLHRYTGQNDIWIGSPVAGRPHADLADLIGMFVNTVVMRGEVHGELTFVEQLMRVKSNTLDALANDRYPFEELVDSLAVRRDVSRNPLFDVMFVLQNTGMPQVVSGDVQFEPVEFHRMTAKFDLTLEIVEQANELRCHFEYRTSLFRRETIERLAGHFVRLIDTFVNNPELKLGDISLLSEAEHHQVVNTFNATTAPYPQELTLPELFRRQAEAAPDKLAASFEANSLTYRELDERANRIALKLLASGLRAGQPVGLMAERSPELLAGLLGILKAGGAYVPLPPDFPEERLRYMAANSGIELVCSQREWLNIAGSAVPGAVLIDLDDAAWREGPSQAPDVDISPEQVAYILYTSGSTGRPKGVMIRHRSVINRIHWMQRAYPLSEDDVILQKTPYSFDVSVWELFWWMLAGASVAFLAPGAEKDPGLLIEAVHRHRVSTMHFVPSMLAAFLEAAHGEPSERLKAKLATLGRVFASGEALHKAHVERFYALTSAMGMSDTRLVNLYGPTEATVDVSVHECAPDSALDFVPIGRPIDNTSLYVMNVGGQAAQPIGVPGELCIAGVQLAVGYANEPELTAEKFVPNPFAAGELMYRTGDLARWMADGQIEYLGRIDDQVKIRGYRIELGEIERTLLLHEAVSECVVTARDDGAGGRRLCAYVVADRECTSGELRRHCGERLPEYMIPASFTQLEAMPLTASGKTDRKALPAPEASMATGTAYAAPGNETEEKLVGIWQELLQRETVGINDNFFELGGNSLLVLRMHKALEQQLGGSLNVTDLFAYPTVSKLAGYIKRETSSTSAQSRISIIPIQLPSQWMPADRKSRTGDYLRMPLSSSTVQYLERLAELEQVDPGLPALGVWIVMLAQSFRQSRYDLPICGFGGGASVVKLELNALGGFSELLAYLRSTLLKEHTSNSNSVPVLVNEQSPDSTIITLLCRGTAMDVPEGWRPLADLTIVVQSTGSEWAIEVEYNAGKIRKDRIKDLMKDFPIWCRRMANERQSKEQTAVTQDGGAAQEGKEP